MEPGLALRAIGTRSRTWGWRIALLAVLSLASGCRKEGEGASSVPVPADQADQADRAAAEAPPDPAAEVEPPAEAGDAAGGTPEPIPVPPSDAARVARIVVGDGSLEIGRPEMARGSGRFSGSLFLRAVERKRGGMLACYNMQLGSDPTLGGDLLLVLVIDTEGMVGVRVEEEDPGLAAAGVTSCVAEKLGAVTFGDNPPGSELWIRLPLHFEP